VPAEVILLAGALVIAGLLATLRPPAPAATTTGAAPSARSATQPREQVLATADGGRVVLDLHPAAGSLGLDLRVLDAKGAPADVVAVVSAQPEGTVLPATALPLQRLATGRFVADPVPLTPPGRWRVSVDLTGEAGRTERATTSLSVP